jgi:hypothetical protein
MQGDNTLFFYNKDDYFTNEGHDGGATHVGPLPTLATGLGHHAVGV